MKKQILNMFGVAVLALLLPACAQQAPVVAPPPPAETTSNGAANGNGGVNGDVTVIDEDHHGIGVRVISAEEWFDTHPEVVASYLRTAERDEFYSYLELNPYKRTLFEGFGFALDYNSPRPHIFSMEGLDMTGRYPFRQRANCFACKSANYPAVRDYLGVEFYALSFEEMRGLMTQPVSCFNCHGNEPPYARVMAHYVFDAFPDISMVSPGSATCAQCHIEYHFDPVTFEVILPYSGLDTMHPVDALWYFNNVATMPDGRPFADYVNPRSGVRQIKVQHPEFEAVYGRYSFHNSLAPVGMAFSCADCHMPFHESAEGVVYRSHEKVSPLADAQLVQNSCAMCHSDLYSEVRAIQEIYYTRVHSLGEHLASLMERLVLAVESGEHSEETLDEIRYTFRNAQFFWDWVVSENSNGAHNSRLIFSTIEYGWSYANEVEALLVQLGY